jgi:phosphatidylethanolamine-binding protein (PEBP) family uncharacterized protein
MHRKICIGMMLGTFIVVMVPIPSAFAATLKVRVDSIKSGKMIPTKYSFCMPAAQGHIGPGPDISPSISWTKGPRGTQSYAVFLTDTDSPKEQREKMNKEGMTVPSSAARQTFFHMVLVDIPANVRSLPEGAASTARVPHGKPASETKIGVPGLNTFTVIFAANDAMKGKYYGYDGECPAWNDEIDPHHAHFMVYALSVKSLNMPQDFDGPAVIDAMKGKVLAEGKLDALYTTNPVTAAKVPK